MPQIILPGLAAGGDQRQRVPEATPLTAEQAARVAELAAASRGYAVDDRGRSVENPTIAVQAIAGLSRYCVAAYVRLPKPGAKDPARELELLERLITTEGDLLYDDLEGYLERAAENA